MWGGRKVLRPYGGMVFVCVLDGCTHYMPEVCPYRRVGIFCGVKHLFATRWVGFYLLKGLLLDDVALFVGEKWGLAGVEKMKAWKDFLSKPFSQSG